MQLPHESFVQLRTNACINENSKIVLFARRPVEVFVICFSSLLTGILTPMYFSRSLNCSPNDAILMLYLGVMMLSLTILNAWRGFKAAEGRTFEFDHQKKLCQIRQVGFTYLPYSEIDSICTFESSRRAGIWISTKTRGLILIQYVRSVDADFLDTTGPATFLSDRIGCELKRLEKYPLCSR